MAIKVLYSAGDAHLTRQFWREAAILQRCRHPNIVQLYGLFSGQDDSICTNGAAGEMRLALTPGSRRLMVVMELLEGGSLRQHMWQPYMRWNQRCATFSKVLDASVCAPVCLVFLFACTTTCQTCWLLQGWPRCAGCGTGADIPA